MNAHGTAFIVFVALMAGVSLLGFFASRRKTAGAAHLEDWSLAGRGFGTVLSWFLIGGDLYTAYTFIAIPALVFGAGAIGFFGVPYTILIYPLTFAIMPQLWRICREQGHVTIADWVGARYTSHTLSTATALTGILATLPYIALQLVGMRIVIAGFGFPLDGFVGQIPLLLAFTFLAGYTYVSGLRAPAFIAVVKDVLIYITIIAAVVIIPQKLGGFAHIFSALPPAKQLLVPPSNGSFGGFSGYVTLALGSACALLLYPHTLTAMMSARSIQTIQRNAALLPAYSLLLGLLSLMGVMALKAGVAQMPQFAAQFSAFHANFAVPALYAAMFPDWFTGVAFAAIAIGALVPAAIMAIAAGSLLARNIYLPWFGASADDEKQTLVAKRAAFGLQIGGLLFVYLLPQAYAINLQLLGGVWIIQTLPMVWGGLVKRGFSAQGLFLGWIVGMGIGTWLAVSTGFTPIYQLRIGSLLVPCYTAIIALVVNAFLAAVVSLLSFRQPVFRMRQ
jgi:SSS family solute:Na+ symporter